MNLQTEFDKAKALNEKRLKAEAGEWKKIHHVRAEFDFIANAPQQFACWEAAMGLIGELVEVLQFYSVQVLDQTYIGEEAKQAIIRAESMGVKV